MDSHDNPGCCRSSVRHRAGHSGSAPPHRAGKTALRLRPAAVEPREPRWRASKSGTGEYCRQGVRVNTNRRGQMHLQPFAARRGISHGQYHDYPDCCRRVVRDCAGDFDPAPPHENLSNTAFTISAGGLGNREPNTTCHRTVPLDRDLAVGAIGASCCKRKQRERWSVPSLRDPAGSSL